MLTSSASWSRLINNAPLKKNAVWCAGFAPNINTPQGASQETALTEITAPVVIAEKDKQPLPKALAEQTLAVREMLYGIGKPVTAEEIASAFKSANRKKIRELLDVLVMVGQAQQGEGGRYFSP